MALVSVGEASDEAMTRFIQKESSVLEANLIRFVL